jgi:peroxiredoxin 2/4
MFNKLIFPCLLFFALSIFAHTEYVQIPQIGTTAPSFETITTRGPISFPQEYVGKWVIFFSMPNAFTPVCSSEMMHFMLLENDFREKNCEILGLTFQNLDMEKLWIEKIQKNLNTNEEFPLIGDFDKEIAVKYGMYQPVMSTEKAARMVVIIDPTSKIRSIMIYPLFNGRNIAEIKRLLIALQESDKDNVVTPANWQEGQQTFNCKKCNKRP